MKDRKPTMDQLRDELDWLENTARLYEDDIAGALEIEACRRRVIDQMWALISGK